MAKRSFGEQPAKALLVSQGRTIAGVARAIDVKPTHLRMALRGITPPCPEVRERLPRLLDYDLGDLFTTEALAALHHGTNEYAARKAAS